MPIDQTLLIPTLATSSGAPSMTIAQLVALMDGGTVPIDQTLLIPTLRGRAGLPAETIADIVALSAGGGGSDAFVQTRIAALLPSNHWPCNGLANAIAFNDNGQISPVSLAAINTPTFANSIPMVLEPQSTATLFTAANSEAGASPSVAGRINTDSIGTAMCFFKLVTLTNADRIGGQGNIDGGTIWALQLIDVAPGERVRVIVTVDSGVNSLSVILPVVLVDNGKWHMVAFRQPGDGSGMNAFYDGTFFTNAQLTQDITGTGNADWWFEDTVVGATFPATIMGIASATQTTRVDFMDGEMMHQAYFPTLLSDDDLTGIWNQAFANGLNA